MKNAFLFTKRVCVFIVLALLQFLFSGNSKHQDNIPKVVFEDRRWTGTVTLDEKYTGITGTSERHVTVTFNNALPTLHRDDVVDPTVNFTDDKGTGSETFHGELIIEGKKFGMSDCSGSGQAELHEVDINDEDYYIYAIGPICTCTGTNLLDGTGTPTGPYTTGIVASDRIGIRQDILSGTKTTTSDIGVGTVTRTVTWHLVRSTNDIDEPCTACGSVIGIENQSLRQAIAITGTPYSLHYRSDRLPGSGGALDIGTWTFNVHHTLLGQRLEFGDGQHRTFGNGTDAIKAVVNEIPGVVPASGYLIAAQDGDEVYAFDRNGKHLRTLDALTGTLIFEFHYNAIGQLSAIIDGDGQTTNIERNEKGLANGISSPFGQRTELALDKKQNLASVANPAGEKIYLAYSATGLLTSMIDPRGFTHTYEYDEAGRLVKDSDPAGGFTNLSRTSTTNGHKVATRTALKRVTDYSTVNQAGGIRKRIVSFPDGTSTNETKWPGGKSEVKYADGTVESLQEQSDPRWSGQAPVPGLLTMKLPSGVAASEKVSRNILLSEPGNPLSLTSAKELVMVNGQTSTSDYQASDRTATLTSPLGRKFSATADDKGRLAELRIGGLAPQKLSYDAQGRLLSTEQGSAGSLRRYSYSYNSDGWLSKSVDPLGNTSSFAYDRAGRMVQLNTPDRRKIEFEYDAGGNITQIIPSGRAAHKFEFNAVSLTTKYSPPGVGGGPAVMTYEYNADRQLTHIRRPDGKNITLSYEASACNCGKISDLITSRGTTSFSYQPKTGLLMKIIAPGGVRVGFDYDGPFVTTETWTGPITGKVNRTYNNFFEIASDKVTNGPTISYRYDNDGLLVQAGELAISHSPLNSLITGTSLGGISETMGYNAFGELAEKTVTVRGSPLYEMRYTRDLLGRIATRIETIEKTTDTYNYDYDPAGRLISVTRNGAGITKYTYDDNDNRLNSGGSPAIYDGQDRLTQFGNSSYSYGAAGELMSKSDDGAKTNYEYDALGNLVKVILPNGKVIQYVVDGRNRRIGIKVNNVLQKGFLYYDDLQVIAELDGNNKIISRFVYGTREHVPDYIIKGGTTYRIITDHVGSPHLVVDVVSGTVAQRLDYDEFGSTLTDSNPGFQPFGFAGGLYDNETKLTRFGARDYDASIGRWTAKDPIGFSAGRTNLYVYAANDPVNKVDPTGLVDVLIEGKNINSDAPEIKNIPTTEGVCVVLGHGTEQGVLEQKEGEKQRNVSVKELVDRINNNSRCLLATEIQLISCRTAGKYAQDLANKSGKKVKAPNRKVKPNRDGKISFKEKGGQWVDHTPQKTPAPVMPH